MKWFVIFVIVAFFLSMIWTVFIHFLQQPQAAPQQEFDFESYEETQEPQFDIDMDWMQDDEVDLDEDWQIQLDQEDLDLEDENVDFGEYDEDIDLESSEDEEINIDQEDDTDYSDLEN